MDVRFDRGPLKRPERKGGALVIEGYAARVHKPGDPLKYAHGDEYRDQSELKRIVDQLPGLPVTLPHPPGLIKTGARARVVGRIDTAWIDGEKAGVRLSITDTAVEREIDEGTKELSLGYAVRVDDAGYQRDSEPDHLAIISSARCGSTCSLRTDDRLDCSATCSCRVSATEGNSMSQKTDKQRADELETTVETLNARIKTLEGDLTAGAQAAESDKVKELQTKLDEANAKIQRFDESLETRADARAALRGEARRHLGAEFRLDGMTDRQIHEAVIKRLDASVNASSENDDQVRGRYNTLTALAARNAESQARVGEILGRTTENPTKAGRADEESYDSMCRDAWKQNDSRARAAGGR